MEEYSVDDLVKTYKRVVCKECSKKCDKCKEYLQVNTFYENRGKNKIFTVCYKCTNR